MKLTWSACTVTLGDLKPWADNPRFSTKAQAERILESFKEFGQVQAVAIGPENEVYDGHQRLSALLTLHGGGYAIDARRASRALTDDERRKLVVTLHTGATGAWNWDALGNWDAGQLQEWGMGAEEVKGWDTDAAQLRTMLEAAQAEGADAEPEIDRAEELREKWQTERGQLWAIGEHRLLCGDSTSREDVERVMGGENASIIVTSPPYNQGLDAFKPSGMHKETRWVDNVSSGAYFDSKPELEYESEQSQALRLWSEFISETGSIFYNHKNRYRGKQVVSPWAWINSSGAKVRQEIIWHREGSVTQNARMFLPCDERIFWLYFGNDFYFDDTTENKTYSSVWKINSYKDREQSMHGCAFPDEIVLRPLRACSKPGDVCFEPYCGSGTTIVACQNLGRRCRAIEISPAYVAVALERMITAFPDIDIHKVDTESLTHGHE